MALASLSRSIEPMNNAFLVGLIGLTFLPLEVAPATGDWTVRLDGGEDCAKLVAQVVEANDRLTLLDAAGRAPLLWAARAPDGSVDHAQFLAPLASDIRIRAAAGAGRRPVRLDILESGCVMTSH